MSKINHAIKYALLFCITLTGCERPQTESSLNLTEALGGTAQTGFERALTPRAFAFPADHAAHPTFRNEWWYVTGNVNAPNGHQFGYQVTLFRNALSPSPPTIQSEWASNQVWMAHVALTDITDQHHYHAQRFAREAVGLAGQTVKPFRVWLEDWQIIGNEQGDFPWTITVNTPEFALNLNLTPTKPAVLQGDRGLSQKSNEAGNASYYYSFSRLQTVGTIKTQSTTLNIQGESWLDREWSTSALGKNQAGWDWFSLQFNDKHDLMYYRLRTQQGETDPSSAGKWILPNGSTQTLNAKHVILTPTRYWQAADGRRYPIQWHMVLPELKRDFTVTAALDDQQMQTAVVYWEGAVRILDTHTQQIIGQGYLELSGY